MFRTAIAGVALILGSSVAVGQTQAPAQPEANQPRAEEPTTNTSDAKTDADAAAAGAVVAGSAGAAAAASADVQADEPLSADELAQKKRAELKAKRKAECLKINVGKPRDC